MSTISSCIPDILVVHANPPISVWPLVAASARYAIDIRFRLLDYWYTSFYTQTVDGTPSLNPLFYLYPNDTNTFPIDTQFFFGAAVLVSPVIEENSTSVEIYLPDDIFYDWNDGFSPVRGSGANITLSDVDFNTIPLHIRGGSVLALRAESANTTTELRRKPFQILVAPGLDGRATGSLYLDEGDLIEQPSTSLISFTYADGSLSMTGRYDYDAGVDIEVVTVLGVAGAPGSVRVGDGSAAFSYDERNQVLTINATIPLTGDATVSVGLTQPYTGAAARRDGGICLSCLTIACVAVAMGYLYA